MATSEREINIALAEVLDCLRSNWKVGGEQLGKLQGSHRQPDIIVAAEGSAPVVIETEVLPAVTVEDDARARLGAKLTDGAEVSSVIAARIPVRFRDLSGGQLRAALRNADAAIEYALLSGRSPVDCERFPDAGWITGGAEDLARLAYQAGIPQHSIALAAHRLELGVTAASERLHEAIQLRPDIGPWIAERLHQEDGAQTHRIAMTIVTNALVFHENLAGSYGIMPTSALRTHTGRFSKTAVLDEWRKILDINYYPIFDIAHQVMSLLPEGLAADILGTLGATAQELINEGVTRSHDLSGIVFQRLIADRKFLATFYTMPSSAALLATLALPGRDGAAYANFKVADFSCGTGTLLSAAYRRLATLHEPQGGNARDFHRNAMEGGVVGADIMPMAVHLTASMLASAYPTEQFTKTRLYTLPYGRQEEGHYALGSLDLLAEDASIRPLFRTGAPERATGTGVEEVTEQLDIVPGEFDLVIMNPPFTRPTNHAGLRSNIPNPAFAGLGTDKEEQDWMAALAKSLGKATCASGNAGLASYFIALADRMVADEGTVAMVLPLAVLQGQSWQKARDLWREDYGDIIVISIAGAKAHDKSFSADTGLGEVLVIAKKSAAAERGRGMFVNLNRRPRTPMEGEEIANQIRRLIQLGEVEVRKLEKGPYGGSRIYVGQEMVDEVLDCPLPEGGQWPAAGIADLSLAQAAYQLSQGILWLPGQTEDTAHPLPITLLEMVAQLGFLHRDINGAGGRGAFDIISPGTTTSTIPTLWGHDASQERTLATEPDSEAIVRMGKEARANEIWAARSRTHHNADFRFNSQSLGVGYTERPSLGGRSWPNLILKQPDRERLYALWGNSTLGVLLYWWHSSKQDGGRGIMPKLQAASMPVLDMDAMSNVQVEQANAIFEDMKHRQMLPFNEACVDEVRKELDYRLLVEVLGVPAELIPHLDATREKLCAEPSIHGGKKSKARPSAPQARMRFHVC